MGVRDNGKLASERARGEAAVLEKPRVVDGGVVVKGAEAPPTPGPSTNAESRTPNAEANQPLRANSVQCPYCFGWGANCVGMRDSATMVIRYRQCVRAGCGQRFKTRQYRPTKENPDPKEEFRAG